MNQTITSAIKATELVCIGIIIILIGMIIYELLIKTKCWRLKNERTNRKSIANSNR